MRFSCFTFLETGDLRSIHLRYNDILYRMWALGRFHLGSAHLKYALQATDFSFSIFFCAALSVYFYQHVYLQGIVHSVVFSRPFNA